MEGRAIDIVVNLWTPAAVGIRQSRLDAHFLDKIGLDEGDRAGVSLADVVARFDRAGIERGLLVATRAGDPRLPSSYAIPYELVAEACAEHPDRFSGLAGVDPSRIVDGVRELERGIREYGFVGAHLYPHWFEAAPDSPIYYPFYAKCCGLDVPILMQVGHCLDYNRDRVLPSVGRPITLDRIAIDFPTLKVVGIHLGWPWTDEMIAVAYKHENVYMAADAYAPKHWPQAFVQFANTWGQDKCLFGTDWPVVGFERAMSEIDALDLREGPKRKFLRDNALRLFGLPDAG